MNDLSPNENKICYWTHRFEIGGMVLIIIATLLTIITRDSFGIVMLFLVGIMLCCHKCFSSFLCYAAKHEVNNVHCHTHDFTLPEEEIILPVDPTVKPKRSVKKDIGIG